MKGLRSLLAAVSLISLAGCVTTHSTSRLPELGKDYSERREILQQVDDWAIRGRLAVRTPDDGFTASLRWRQREERYDANLNGPLGVGAMSLTGDPELLRIERGNGKNEVIHNPSEALADALGWSIPVENFRFWALGVESPLSPAIDKKVEQGLLITLQQDGWSIQYREYQEIDGASLPRKLVATQGEARLTFLIREWQIPGR